MASVDRLYNQVMAARYQALVDGLEENDHA